MEDYFELLIFLLFAVFSLLSRFLTSKKKPPVRNPHKQPRHELEDQPQQNKPVVAREEPATKPVSFEDVLRELMGESPRPRTEPPPIQPRKAMEEAREKVSEAGGEIKKAAHTAKKATRIADKITLKDSGKRIKPIEVSGPEKSLAEEVSQALKNPKSAREAIILSEIIHRKYF